MVDAASRLTHLSDRKFLPHFRTQFSWIKPWHLPPPDIRVQAESNYNAAQ